MADKCLSLDGNDLVDFGDIATHDMGTSDYSLLAWIKTSMAGTGYIINKNWANPSWDLHILSGKIKASINDGANSAAPISDDTVNNGEWHLVGVSQDRSANGQIYVDGLANGDPVDISAVGDIDNSNPLVFGCQKSNGSTANFYTGLIDEILIYKRLLDADEWLYDYNSGRGRPNPYSVEGLVGWWRMDEGSGSSIYDRSVYNNTGTITGATWVNGKNFDLILPVPRRE